MPLIEILRKYRNIFFILLIIVLGFASFFATVYVIEKPATVEILRYTPEQGITNRSEYKRGETVIAFYERKADVVIPNITVIKKLIRHENFNNQNYNVNYYRSNPEEDSINSTDRTLIGTSIYIPRSRERYIEPGTYSMLVTIQYEYKGEARVNTTSSQRFKILDQEI